ncbi:hypothetical protein [Streptomyces sp. NPDC019937]|uniref:hypothetical protein n=1 Tax=Streptomyces sp. NPDC019937 TaxID=3154787 RepID=UPI0034009B26
MRVVLETPVERLHHTLTDGRRGIEPGDVTMLAGLAADDLPHTATITVGAQVTRRSPVQRSELRSDE